MTICKCLYMNVSTRWVDAGVDNLPETATEESLEDDDFLQAFHHALLEVLRYASCNSIWHMSNCSKPLAPCLGRWQGGSKLCELPTLGI